jgi:trehalose 6-phosphate phosphatase
MNSAVAAQDPPPLPGRDARWALFLDIDGTLVPIAETPSAIRPDVALNAFVGCLAQALDGGLALISGRSLENVDALFAPLRLPTAGQHGVERRSADGGIHRCGFDAGPLHRLAAVALDLASRYPGVEVEEKGLSVAVHFRRAPQHALRIREALERELAATGAGLVLQPGKMVLEAKPAGRDKGVAIREFMAEVPFRGRVPVFVGDDVTDEYGFRVVNGMAGVTVKVGPGDTDARWRLADPAAVRRWLAGIAECGGEKEVMP